MSPNQTVSHRRTSQTLSKLTHCHPLPPPGSNKTLATSLFLPPSRASIPTQGDCENETGGWRKSKPPSNASTRVPHWSLHRCPIIQTGTWARCELGNDRFPPAGCGHRGADAQGQRDHQGEAVRLRSSGRSRVGRDEHRGDARDPQ